MDYPSVFSRTQSAHYPKYPSFASRFCIIAPSPSPPLVAHPISLYPQRSNHSCQSGVKLRKPDTCYRTVFGVPFLVRVAASLGRDSKRDEWSNGEGREFCKSNRVSTSDHSTLHCIAAQPKPYRENRSGRGVKGCWRWYLICVTLISRFWPPLLRFCLDSVEEKSAC